ncbi:ABC transporter permease [Paraflavitalea sp. CAU 1676]|uniref:MlaE family ABC transporter permease n=1 Tax=Paraflavitalea sp. CAU 1676 TaxID=3032598 RepID=UPI0023D9C092|nr:ABC transporter permease [Paraflavitalea sp. CAU 1676]MDF2189905.1 ABC transporter permease [Paraflavitalea sp. CAU 1676]
MGEPSRKTRTQVFTKQLDSFFMDIYAIGQFTGRFFREAFRPPIEWKEIIRQFYMVGYKSLALVSVTSFVTGIVFTKQSRPSLAEFGATSWLPSLVAIAIIRALAPLVTALIAAGKVGSNIGAELGSMRVTEQIDAMEVSAVNPFRYLVVTRVLATTCMLPLLMLYMSLIALLGAYLNVHQNEQTSLNAFFQNAFEQISFLDLFASTFKSLVFGFTIGIVSSYKGYYTTQGTQGVGKAANSAVVISMFLIFIEEIIIVQAVNSIRP